MRILQSILLIMLSVAFIFSCEEDKYFSSSDAKLQFSVDTVMFDTVFTSIGSATEHLKIYNPYDQKVLISSIRLASGDDSNFRINVNGISSNEVQDIEIAPKDSIYIFVEVTVDPNGQNLPMVVKDSIEFLTNKSVQDVKLIAWGQDFHLIKQQVISTSTWTNDKPYLVYNYAYVDSNEVLTIDPGTKVFFHKDAGLFVEGRVLANGTVDEPIIFQGDRLEKVYSEIPDQWRGILLFSGSHNNVLNHVVIKNANIGLQVGNIEDEGSASVEISNIEISNMAYAGIFALTSSITSYNCLVSNCGYYCVALLVGGDYKFYHTTIANYWGGYGNGSRTSSSLAISNILITEKADGSQVTYVGDLNHALFANSIVAGNLISDNEIELGNYEEALFNFKFDHCMIQVADTFDISDTDYYSTIYRIKNENFDSIFADPYELNYELDSLSIAKDKGDLDIAKAYPLDIKGNSRLDDLGPDLGAFERVEVSSAEE